MLCQNPINRPVFLRVLRCFNVYRQGRDHFLKGIEDGMNELIKTYEISMEVEGTLAMWSRPDTGSSPTSYPIPTWSAAKGLFESIAFFRDGRAWINPTRVEVCKARTSANNGGIHFQKYMTNYRGPLREPGKANYQQAAQVVASPCYRLYANIENGSGKPPRSGDNPGHALQAMFARRLKNGQCHHTPCLGWSEFVPRYWGQIRESTEVDTGVNLNLVSVLKGVFDTPLQGQFKPTFQHGDNAWIKEGVFHYAQ